MQLHSHSPGIVFIRCRSLPGIGASAPSCVLVPGRNRAVTVSHLFIRSTWGIGLATTGTAQSFLAIIPMVHTKNERGLRKPRIGVPDGIRGSPEYR